MRARLIRLSALAVGFILLALTGAAPQSAWAGGCNCVPPPCCAPPTPPPPPQTPCCGSGGHQINVPGVNVSVGATVVVNASASANVSGSASGSGNVVVFGGGGGGGGYLDNGPVGLIQGLNVQGEAQAMRRVAYQASRTRIRIVVIQAFCLDDKQVPHPASQVSPDRDIAEGYEGEVYRCIAGTHMQFTFADYDGKIAFDHGQSVNCQKGEALYYGGASGGGKLECRPQKPARDCNERSLLRRFGAGVKILKVILTESYTAYREETVQSAQVSTFNMTVDGGVGGVMR